MAKNSPRQPLLNVAYCRFLIQAAFHRSLFSLLPVASNVWVVGTKSCQTSAPRCKLSHADMFHWIEGVAFFCSFPSEGMVGPSKGLCKDVEEQSHTAGTCSTFFYLNYMSSRSDWHLFLVGCRIQLATISYFDTNCFQWLRVPPVSTRRGNGECPSVCDASKSELLLCSDRVPVLSFAQWKNGCFFGFAATPLCRCQYIVSTVFGTSSALKVALVALENVPNHRFMYAFELCRSFANFSNTKKRGATCWISSWFHEIFLTLLSYLCC